MSDAPPAHVAATPVVEPRIRYAGCPLCDHRDFPFVREADCTRHALYQPGLPPLMRWHRCAACGHVFTDGYFGPAALDLLFRKTHDNQRVGADVERQRIVSARMVERVARHAPPPGRWLDVGFGNGSLIFTAAEFGYTAAGLDLRPDNVAAMQRIGFEAHCATIDAYGAPPGAFSVVSLCDVLEHMPFPKIGLAATLRLLKPGGVLLVSMPNSESVVWLALDQQNLNPYWAEIEHHHNFSRRRLYALLEECGFAPRAYAVSDRYRACMEVIAERLPAAPANAPPRPTPATGS
jgi:protein O-GlcNAc transferase